MSFMNGNSFADRQAAAAKARKAMAEKFLEKSKYDPSDPAVIEREAKRKAILEGRAVRESNGPGARPRKPPRRRPARPPRRPQGRSSCGSMRCPRGRGAARAGSPGAGRVREEARAGRALRRPQGAQEEEEVRRRTMGLSDLASLIRGRTSGTRVGGVLASGAEARKAMAKPLRLGVAGLGVVGAASSSFSRGRPDGLCRAGRPDRRPGL